MLKYIMLEVKPQLTNTRKDGYSYIVYLLIYECSASPVDG